MNIIYVDRYVGVPNCTPVKFNENPNPLKGTWTDKSSYEINVNIENPDKTQATITIKKFSVTRPVKLKFPTDQQQLLLDLLKFRPNDFIVILKRQKGQTDKISIYSPGMGRLTSFTEERPEKKVKFVRLRLSETCCRASTDHIAQLITTIAPKSASEEKMQVTALAILQERGLIKSRAETSKKNRLIHANLNKSISQLHTQLDIVGAKKSSQIIEPVKQLYMKAFKNYAMEIHGLFLDDHDMHECSALFEQTEETANSLRQNTSLSTQP